MPAILSDSEAVSAWLDSDLHGLDALKVLKPHQKSEVQVLISFQFYERLKSAIFTT